MKKFAALAYLSGASVKKKTFKTFGQMV